MNKPEKMNHRSQPADPIASLLHDHQDASKQLQLLEESVISMNSSGFNRAAFETLSNAIRFFDNEFRQHDKKEEQILFPLLEKHLPGITREYRNEHRELWSAFNRLRSCVSDVEDGRLRGSSRQELVETARQIVELLRSHMMNENTYLFARAKEILSSEEYTQLSEKIEVELL